MSILDIITAWMIKVDTSGNYTSMPDIPDHKLQLTRFLINSKFNTQYSLEEITKLLYEEGLLGPEYYFTQSYLDKYSSTKLKSKVNGQNLQGSKSV